MRAGRASLGRIVAGSALVALAGTGLVACLTTTNFGPVACATDDDCLDPDYGHCDMSSRRCAKWAQGDMAESTAVCTSENCPAPGVCNGGVCGQCDDATEIGTSNECKTYHSSTPYCVAGACVECVASSDCAGSSGGKSCHLNRCGGCVQHSECATQVCSSRRVRDSGFMPTTDTGSCVPETDIVYVDNRGTSPADCESALDAGLHDGLTWETALCDIPAALALQKPWVRVRGSLKAYSPIAFGDKDTKVAIVGPGRDASPSAKIVSIVMPMDIVARCALEITSKGKIDVLIDGMELQAVSVSDVFPPTVRCIGNNATLTHIRIINSKIAYSHGIGLQSFSCDVVLDADDIRFNFGGGISLLTATPPSTYSVTNTFIIDNGTGPNGMIGVQIDQRAIGTFAFNTVVNNTPNNLAGGIECQGSQQIESSIVVGNSAQMVNKEFTQFVGSCKLVDVVTGGDMLTGMTTGGENVKLLPDFVNKTNQPHDYRLLHSPMAENNSDKCCIDQLTPVDMGGLRTWPSHDVDLTARPQGSAWDIGAHELPR